MRVETCVTRYLFETKKYFFIFFTPFYAFFSTLPSTQTMRVIALIFFFELLAMKNWAMNMHFNPTYSLRLFLGGRQTPPPPAIHRFRPPAFIGLKVKGWLDCWMVGWLDDWMVGWLDGWMTGWLDG